MTEPERDFAPTRVANPYGPVCRRMSVRLFRRLIGRD